MDYNNLAVLVTNTAIDAGKVILEVYDTEDFGVEMKGDNSPLTKADKLANDVIIAALKQTDLPFITEEEKSKPYTERKDWGYAWIIDPLDGTKEFIKKNGEFTVNIALVKNGKPVLGVVYAPVLDEMFIGVESTALKIDNAKTLNLGSWDSIVKSGISLPKPKETDKYVAVGSRSHMSPETEEFFDELKEKYGEIEVQSKGSSLKLCMVAEGVADVYPRFAPTMEWDTAAGHAVALASGATVIRKDTKEALEYNKEDLLNPWFIVQR